MRSGRRELFRRAARRGRLVRPLRLRAAVERDSAMDSAWPVARAARRTAACPCVSFGPTIGVVRRASRRAGHNILILDEVDVTLSVTLSRCCAAAAPRCLPAPYNASSYSMIRYASTEVDIILYIMMPIAMGR